MLSLISEQCTLVSVLIGCESVYTSNRYGYLARLTVMAHVGGHECVDHRDLRTATRLCL